MQIVFMFLSGMFLFNALPHLIKGISGQTHMTPFKRVSDPLLNVIWSFCNILVGLILLGIINRENLIAWPWQVNFSEVNSIAFLLGGLIMALMDANLFKNPNARLPWHKD